MKFIVTCVSSEIAYRAITPSRIEELGASAHMLKQALNENKG
jgi:hypothetical protein